MYCKSLRAGRFGVLTPMGATVFPFSSPTRPAVEPTQLPVHWVPGLFPAHKAAGVGIWQPTPQPIPTSPPNYVSIHRLNDNDVSNVMQQGSVTNASKFGRCIVVGPNVLPRFLIKYLITHNSVLVPNYNRSEGPNSWRLKKSCVSPRSH